MPKIGIMQGRVLPERLDRLQVFSVSQWKEEIGRIQTLGFDCIELLYDKKRMLEKLLRTDGYAHSLAIRNAHAGDVFSARSICMDYLATLSILNPETQHLFFHTVRNVLKVLNSNSSIRVLVVPLLEAGSIETNEDLLRALDWISETGLDEIAVEHNIVLALEMNLPAGQIVDVFAGHSLSNIGICYDLGNARATGMKPEEEIIILNGLIVHVHIKDRQVNGPNVMLGQGDVNFDACFCALDRIGYEGQMILETIYEVSPEAEAARNLQFVQARVAEFLS